jgi:hypothetical protein
VKRSDDVFFFTLIDFLLQVFFFGLLLYVVARSANVRADHERAARENQIEQVKRAAGVSNLTELTDLLTKLAPIRDLQGTADFIARAGGTEKVMGKVALVDDAGGAENLERKLDKLRKLEEGTGRPPCLFDEVDGKKVVRPLAVVVANDTHIVFQQTNPELEKVLSLLGLQFATVRELPLADFRRTFSTLVAKKPECRYTLTFREQTRFVDARDAARFAFYLSIAGAK